MSSAPGRRTKGMFMSMESSARTRQGRAEARPCTTMPVARSAHVLRDELGHLEHRHLGLAIEDLLQVGIGVDVALVLLVLEAVLLDVDPQLLGDFGARHALV